MTLLVQHPPRCGSFFRSSMRLYFFLYLSSKKNGLCLTFAHGTTWVRSCVLFNSQQNLDKNERTCTKALFVPENDAAHSYAKERRFVLFMSKDVVPTAASGKIFPLFFDECLPSAFLLKKRVSFLASKTPFLLVDSLSPFLPRCVFILCDISLFFIIFFFTLLAFYK